MPTHPGQTVVVPESHRAAMWEALGCMNAITLLWDIAASPNLSQ